MESNQNPNQDMNVQGQAVASEAVTEQVAVPATGDEAGGSATGAGDEADSLVAGAGQMAGEPAASATVVEAMAAETAVPMTSVMEEPADGVGAMDEPKAPKGKTKNLGFKIAVAVLAVVAVGGIGFGVWAMISGQQETKSLNSQIASLKQANAQLMENASNTTEGTTTETNTDETTEEVVVEPAPAVDTSEYIYIGEFGIKIRKPENWKDIVRQYEYYNGYPQAASDVTIRESGDAGDGVYITLGGGVACEYENTVCIDTEVGKVTVGKLVGELTPGAEDPISEEFWSFVTNPDNYSAI